MSGKLVRKIRTTTVRPQDAPQEAALTVHDYERLTAFREANHPRLKLRRAGLTADQIRNLEVLRWAVQTRRGRSGSAEARC